MAAATGARKALVDECPASCIGALLTMLLQQVSRCSVHLAALLLITQAHRRQAGLGP